MGFDIYGVNPKIKREENDIHSFSNSPEQEEINWKINAETGNYFRNTRVYWLTLASYIVEFTDVLDKKDKKLFFYNENHFIPGNKALLLSLQLQNLINTGHTLECIKDVEPLEGVKEIKQNGKKEFIKELFVPFDVENVQFFTTFCKNSGGFRIS
jgi:hypothetical protein